MSVLNLINKELRKYLPKDKSILSSAMRYSVFAGGKRFRPLLMIESAVCCGGSVKEIMPVACAVEMAHTFTLIHDDLPAMDNSGLRRGKPTCHKAYGEDIAILAGDALNTLAFEVIAKNIKGDKSSRVAAELSHALIDVVYGQVLDIKAEGKRISIKEVENIHLKKTAALIECCTKIGAIIAGASDKKIKLMADYGRNLGLAFQIADDILDYESTSEMMGKPAGADIKNNKATYPAVVGVEQAKILTLKYANQAKNCLSPFGQKARNLMLIADYSISRRK